MPIKSSLDLPHTNTFQENVIALAEHYHQKTIEPGHGMFFDFSNTPEYEKPVVEYLIKKYKWTLENPSFIRRPQM